MRAVEIKLRRSLVNGSSRDGDDASHRVTNLLDERTLATAPLRLHVGPPSIRADSRRRRHLMLVRRPSR
jgi:hypothetical protein